MNCEASKDLWMAGLSHQLSTDQQRLLQHHLSECPVCSLEFEGFEELWTALGKEKTPEPSPAMRTDFYQQLEVLKAEAKSKQISPLVTIGNRLRSLLTLPATLQLGYSIILLVMGAMAGYTYHQRETKTLAYREQVDTLSVQVQEMKKMVMLAMLENPSATERLKAVSYSSEFPRTDPRVIEALLTTLNRDPNVNVRLVTLDALTEYGDDPYVRKMLVQSLQRQDSPVVQAALADVMLQLQEKGAVKVFRKLLQQDNLDEAVKQKIEKTIQKLS